MQLKDTRQLEKLRQFGFPEKPPRPGTVADFAAHPRKIGNREGPLARQTYRDPINQWFRVAPQNLMYDRRIVRGNTFAALVIPVNMQPNIRPMTTMEQRQPNKNFKLKQSSQRILSAKGSQHLRPVRSQKSATMSSQHSGSRAGQETHMQSTHLDNLSDYENMVQEETIQPDYLIDRPPSPFFFQESPGHDKSTILNDRTEEELFDFDSEIAPILQVLVGKTLETARIEVIEEYEIEQLRHHKRKFKSLRESQLIAVQRQEAAMQDHMLEIERRNQQVLIVSQQLIDLEQKQIARHVSKRALVQLKRNVLSELFELGILKSRFETDLGSKIIQEIHQNTINSAARQMASVEFITNVLNETGHRMAKTHKKSIERELKRRQNAIVAAKMEQIRIQQETVERKKRRAEMREEARIANLQFQILYHVVHQSLKVELKADTQVLDISEQNRFLSRGHISTFGGMIGELIISLSALNDYITTMTPNSTFKFTGEHIENLLALILDQENGRINLILVKEPEGEEQKEEDTASLIQKALSSDCHASIGLKFLLNNIQQSQLNQEIANELLKAMVNIASYVEPKVQQDEDAEPKIPLPKYNIKYRALKQKIVLQFTTKEEAAKEEENLTAFVQVKNFREPPFGSLEHDGKIPTEPKTPLPGKEIRVASAKSGLSSDHSSVRSNFIEPVQWELIPKQIICVPRFIEEQSILVQHTEAVYLIRKQIAECAQRMLINELAGMPMNNYLQMCQSKQKILNNYFEFQLINNMGFNLGCKYVGTNLTILYKTFLTSQQF